jgi:hypothetical protein
VRSTPPRRSLWIALAASFFLVFPAGAAPPRTPAHPAQITPTIDRDYLAALQVANLFVFAWATRDDAAGTELISDRLQRDLKKGRGESWFKVYMSGLGNPHHEAFEIGPGRRLSPTRFVFPVRLYEIGSRDTQGYAYTGIIEIMRQPDRWAVDKLPKTPDNP